LKVADEKRLALFKAKLQSIRSLSDSPAVAKLLAKPERATASALVGALGRIKKELLGLISSAPTEFQEANLTDIDEITKKLDLACDALDKDHMTTLGIMVGRTWHGFLQLVKQKKPSVAEVNAAVAEYDTSMADIIKRIQGDGYMEDFKHIAPGQRVQARQVALDNQVVNLKAIDPCSHRVVMHHRCVYFAYQCVRSLAWCTCTVVVFLRLRMCFLLVCLCRP
jgi:hypothetical protein